MDTLVLVSMLIGACLGFTGWIWGFIVSRRIHVGWGIAILIACAIALPLFALAHWDKAKRPFIVWIIGIVLFFWPMLVVK